jgi:uncharacterized protein (DUF2141 family)
MSLRTHAWVFVVVLLGSAVSASAAAPGLQARVRGLRNDEGQVGCLLFDSEAGFPGKQERALQRTLASIADGRAVCKFDVPPGSYAIVAMHDENRNGELDTNFVGMPKEGYGASNGARGRFGPKYEDARFDYSGGSLTMPIQLEY